MPYNFVYEIRKRRDTFHLNQSDPLGPTSPNLKRKRGKKKKTHCHLTFFLPLVLSYFFFLPLVYGIK